MTDDTPRLSPHPSSSIRRSYTKRGEARLFCVSPLSQVESTSVRKSRILILLSALLLAVGGYQLLQIWNAYRAARTRESIRTLRETLDRATGQELYLVVDTIHNRLQIRRGETVVHEAVCATGSAKIFYGPGRQTWKFETPRGLRRVKIRVVDPVWIKPAWAFLEEGLPVPVASDSSRYDDVALGRYALDLANGYLIHGTLYTNLIGTPVTHGCIRLDDNDLEKVYNLTRPGTRVYIY